MPIQQSDEQKTMKHSFFSLLALTFFLFVAQSGFSQNGKSQDDSKNGAQIIESEFLIFKMKEGTLVAMDVKTGKIYEVANPERFCCHGDPDFDLLRVQTTFVITPTGRAVGAGQVTEIVK